MCSLFSLELFSSSADWSRLVGLSPRLALKKCQNRARVRRSLEARGANRKSVKSRTAADAADADAGKDLLGSPSPFPTAVRALKRGRAASDGASEQA